MKKTVIELDLVGYSTIGANLEEGLGPETLLDLNEQIQEFIDKGLAAVKRSRQEAVLQTTGDGAILFFDTASEAFTFAVAVHDATAAHNATRSLPIAKRVFRVGAATGKIAMVPNPVGGFKIAGGPIFRAVRLEAKASPGGLLIDEATYSELPSAQRAEFGSEQSVPGKREELFKAYLAQPNARGLLDAKVFAAKSPKLELWQEKLAFLQEQEAITSNPSLKFELKKQIEEAKSKVEEFQNKPVTAAIPVPFQISRAKLETLSATELGIVDLVQEKRFRDFVEIIERGLDKFEIPISPIFLRQLSNGQQACTADNLRIVGLGLWNLVYEKNITQAGHDKNFEAFWGQLLDELRQRFSRAIPNKQWADLRKVLEDPQFRKNEWDQFVDRWVDAPFPVDLDRATTAALAPYRRQVIEKCKEINLSGFGGHGAQSDSEGKAELSKVYVGLDVKAEGEIHTRVLAGEQLRQDHGSIPVLKRLAGNPRLVLIGLPGSGKSTLLQYFGLCLAHCGLKPDSEWRECLNLWPDEERDLIPIFVELRQFAGNLPTPLPAVSGGQHLTDYILGQLKPASLKKCADPIQEALTSGRAIVFLDGLDEVSDDDELRRFVLETVKAFSNGDFQDSRIVVTCRPRSYDEPAWQLEGFEKAELAALDREKIAQFIDRFYAEVAERDPLVADVSTARKSELKTALRREELQELATNPLMLTVMAWLHRFEPLPGKRAKILDRLVDQLLYKWEERRHGNVSTLAELLQRYGLEMNTLRRVLCRLAFEARHSNSPRSADSNSIPRQKLLADLSELPPKKKATKDTREDWALQVSHVIDRRTGLLVPQGDEGDSLIMPYKLQEFLAGEHLTNNAALEALGDCLIPRVTPGTFHRVVAQLVGEDGYWEEVVKWAAAFQAHVKKNNDLTRDLADELCNYRGDSEIIKLRRAVIAEEILLEVGLTEVEITHEKRGPECLARVREKLDELMFSEGLSPKQRAAAGSARGWLEELPAGIGVNTEALPDITWIDIHSGEFLMGDEASWEGGIQPLPTGINTSYKISRYPVTVNQFQSFVDDDGYETVNFWNWSPQVAHWYKEMKEVWLREGRKPGPGDYEPVFQTPNHPRVGVSWFEAMAFCRWLNLKFGLKSEAITLPSEPQWERAARGAESRRWTSEDASVLGRQCNTDQSKIRHTSAVGLFPAGDTPPENGNGHGVAELAGNVWEWCSSRWTDNPGSSGPSDGTGVVVARGGSWSFGHDVKYISPLRRGFVTGERFNDVGFRLIRTT